MHGMLRAFLQNSHLPIRLTLLQGDSLLVGTSNSVVHRFRKDTPEHLGSVGSVNGVPVQCIAIDPKGKKVAIGSQCVLFLSFSSYLIASAPETQQYEL